LGVRFGEAEGHNLIPTNNRRNQNGRTKPHKSQKALEQGQADRSETTTQAQGNLVNPNPTANVKAGP
jgi:hypothetical protein